MRRFALAALVVAPLACGITYSPGDFLAPAEGQGPGPSVFGDASPVEASSPSGPVDATTADAPVDGSLAPRDIHILLFGGHRDLLPGESGAANVAETMRTTFTDAGGLEPFTFDAPPPLAASWTHAELAGGTLFVHNNGTVARAPFADGILGSWSSSAIKPAPGGAPRPWILDSHGLLAGPVLIGTKQTLAAPFAADGGAGDWTQKSATLSLDRLEITLARSGELVYALGGKRLGALTPADSTVEVAKLGANGDLGNFSALPALGSEGQGSTMEYPTYAPIVATSEKRIVVLGAAAANGTLTDVALAAPITDANGSLGPWRMLPKLPAAMAGCALVVTTNHILVFGGQRATMTTDAILDLAIQADGTYGTEWKQVGTLPAPRSGLVAVTYP